MIHPKALKLCANGGMKLDADGLASACCDPCQLAIDAERARIAGLSGLVSFSENGEGMLLYNNITYNCRAVFEYSYYAIPSDSFPTYKVEYFACDCTLAELYSSEFAPSYRFFPFPGICDGCVFKYLDPTLLTTVDEWGSSEQSPTITSRSVWTWTNATAAPVYVWLTEGGDESPHWGYDVIDDWAQFLPSGETPSDGEDIYQRIVLPGETVVLWSINRPETGHDDNPWEIHCKVWMAEITCDPCEVRVYKAMYETADETLRTKYGAGFYTGGGSNAPYGKAFTKAYNVFTIRLYGVTCDTCEVVLLWSGGVFDAVPYTEDATACDGEGEVQ